MGENRLVITITSFPHRWSVYEAVRKPYDRWIPDQSTWPESAELMEVNYWLMCQDKELYTDE